VGVPASVVVNALAFRAPARMAGTQVPCARALVVMVLARAASLLPLPGGWIVRVCALKQVGATYPRAILATGATGLTWIAATLVTAGSLLVAAAGDGRGRLAVAAAMSAIGVAFVVLLPEHGILHSMTLVGQALLAGFGMVAAAVVRLSLILLALGSPVTYAQAAVLTVAEVLAMALAVVPGGVGVREVVAGIFGAAVGLPASLGVIATVTDRLVEYVILAPVGLAAWIRLRPSVALDCRSDVGTAPRTLT
jgi:uncharacterized membrane protein YbhN (UPF0104 family)